MNGLMAASTRATGKAISCMDRVFTLGLMVESMMATTLTIRKVVMALSTGQTAVSTPAGGSLANNTVRLHSLLPMENLAAVSGTKAKDSNGLWKETTILLKNDYHK